MLQPSDFAHAGRIPEPDGEGFAGAGGAGCGDRVRITLALDAFGGIAAARFGAAACAHATAAAAWACRRSEGRPFLDAARASLADCARDLALTAAARDCASVALDALHAALGDAAERTLALPLADDRVAVAMSGGVDSAVALLRERAAGGDVLGLTLRLWIDEAAPDAERACCSPAAVARARESCHELGIPHVTLDGRSAFRSAVVEPFVAGYARGETPNPCTTCNGSYRLAALVDAAARLGAGHVATGHYARIVERGGRTLVARGADDAKDQSYMLARVPEAVLERLRLPLGDATKAAVRAEAAAAGMAAATARESQDVCFLGGGALGDFLAREGVELAPGSIRDEAGRELGRHSGAVAYTPGQRRGLGVSAPAPLYVLRADAGCNELVVGPRNRLACSVVDLREERIDPGTARVHAKLRARSPTVAARVERGAGGARLILEEPVYGAASGQTAVLYDDTGCVVGSGVIAPAAGAS